MDKWEEKIYASTIMNVLGTVLILVAGVVSLLNGGVILVWFFALSGVACGQVACVNI